MTDVSSDNGAPGPVPAASSDPPVIRRSTYAPPPPGAEPPIFDDDALADAMAAEVSSYTSPITLPKLPMMPPPAGAEFDVPPPLIAARPATFMPSAAPAEVVQPPAPVGVSWDGAPLASETPAEVPAESPSEDDMLRSLGGASTLEAIERLEKEIQLISRGEAPTLDLTSAPDPTPSASRPADALELAPMDAQVDAVMDVPAVTEPAPEPPSEPEPALDHPAAGHFFPAAYEPIAPQSTEAPRDAEVEPDAFVWLAPTAPADEPGSPQPVESSPIFPGLPEVDETLIDPVAAAELSSAQPPSSALPEWRAAEVPSDQSTAAVSPDIQFPAPTASDMPPQTPWWATTAPVDGAWDLATPQPQPDPEPSPSLPLPPPPIVPLLPVPESASSPDRAAEAAFPSVFAPPVDQPFDAPAPDVAAPDPSVLGPEDPGPVFATPVPISTEPPVGPESPDWLDAPPPSYSPPELVEPPPFIEPASDAAFDPHAPITANTMAQLPVPFPTEQPRLEDRAELPPPPGYEDIPIMSSDALAAPLAPSPFYPVGPPPVAMAISLGVPEATESVTLDHDEDDVIDEVDRVARTGAIPISSVGTIEPLAPPSEPISTIRRSEGEPALVDQKPQQLSAFDVETAGSEPTALDLRAGRAARLFWLWFAANSSVLSLGLGAVLLGTGMSLRQAIVATLAGVAISFLPLGLGTLAGKWSGQPTMIVSRATFGHAGNILPALLAVATRVLWGGVLLWLLATAVAQVLVGAGLDAGLGATIWQLVGLVVGFVIAAVVAVFGYGFVAQLQLVLSVISAILIVGAAVLTFQHLDFTTALMVHDGSWILVISGAALVFSVVGLAWVHSSSDLARYQRPASYGGSSMLWATFGATLPPFALIAWGAMLAASDPVLARGLTSNPLAALASLLPAWYPAPLLAAVALGLLSGAVLTMYSGGFALQALGVRVRRSFGTFIAAILVLATAAALLFVVADFSSLLRDLVITVAVPVAAWAGIFAAEMMIRNRRFHTPSLLAPGGLYPQVRWLNFLALIVISVLGLGLVTSAIPGLAWEGFLYGLLGVGPHELLARSDLGVFVALLLGILVPLVGGIPAIRRQERTAVSS